MMRAGNATFGMHDSKENALITRDLRQENLASGFTPKARARVFLRRRWLGLILLLHLALSLSLWQPGPDWQGDWAGYLMQAETLRDGTWAELARQTDFRQAHSQPLDSPDYYPWGFPLWVLPATWWSAHTFVLAKASLLLANVAVLWALRHWLRRDLTPPGQAALVGWLAAHHWLAGFPQQLLAGTLFWLISVAWLWAMDRWLSRQPVRAWRAWQMLALGGLLFLSVFVRGQGWAWVAAMPLLQLLIRWRQGSWQRLGLDLLPWLSLGLLVALNRALLPQGGGYLGFFFTQSPWDTLPEMALYYAKVAYKFFEQGPPGWAGTVPLGLLSLALTLPWLTLGTWRSVRQHPGWTLACAVMLAVLLVYPFKEGYRFLWPLLPLPLFAVIKGVEASRGPWRRVGRSWLLLMILSTLAGSLYRAWKPPDAPRPLDPTAQAAWAYLRNHTEPQTRVTFSKPRVLTYLTDRPATFMHSRLYPQAETDLLLVPTDTLANLADSTALWLDNQPVLWKNDDFSLFDLR